MKVHSKLSLISISWKVFRAIQESKLNDSIVAPKFIRKRDYRVQEEFLLNHSLRNRDLWVISNFRLRLEVKTICCCQSEVKLNSHTLLNWKVKQQNCCLIYLVTSNALSYWYQAWSLTYFWRVLTLLGNELHIKPQVALLVSS